MNVRGHIPRVLKAAAAVRSAVLGALVVLLVAVMTVVVLWQVIARMIDFSATWTEELSTYLLMWCGLIGAACAYGRKAHVGMEYFASLLNPRPRLRAALDLLINLLVAYFAVQVLCIGGIGYARNAFASGQLSPTMKNPFTGMPVAVGYLDLCLPISGFFFVTYCIEFFLRDLAGLAGSAARPGGA